MKACNIIERAEIIAKQLEKNGEFVASDLVLELKDQLLGFIRSFDGHVYITDDEYLKLTKDSK